MPFKFGRQPRDMSRWAPVLEDYLRVHPVTLAAGLENVLNSEDVDRASKVTSVPMYANDSIGDCTIAGIAHGYTALGVYADHPQALFTDAEIIRAYSAVSGYDPSTDANDNGAQLQDVLAHMRKTGMTDTSGKTHKVLMYAALGNPSNTLLLSRVLKTFGYVYLGINCPESAEEQFGNSPWTYVPGSPILGGHCIGLHRRQPYGSRVGVFGISTWGALQPMTISFIQNYVDEAWAVITEDWLEANGSTCDGISLAQLESDMKFV